MPAPSGEISNLRADVEESAASNQAALISVVRNTIVTLQDSKDAQAKSTADRARAMLDSGDVYNSAALIIGYLRGETTGSSRRKTRKVRRTRKSRR